MPQRPCPSCAQTIYDTEVICPFCGFNRRQQPLTPIQQPQIQRSDKNYECLYQDAFEEARDLIQNYVMNDKECISGFLAEFAEKVSKLGIQNVLTNPNTGICPEVETASEFEEKRGKIEWTIEFWITYDTPNDEIGF